MKKGAPRIVVRPLVCGPEGSGLFRQRRRDRLHHLGDALAQARVLDRVIGADQLERLAARHRIGWVLLILVPDDPRLHPARRMRSEEHTSELQSLMRSSYAGLCLKK